MPLPQENNSSAPEQAISEGIQQLSAKETLPLQAAPGGKGVSNSIEIEAVSDNIHGKVEERSFEIETVRMEDVVFELPETPTPLPLAYSDTGTAMPTNQAYEAQDDSPGRLQFSPLLRLSQSRGNGKTPEA